MYYQIKVLKGRNAAVQKKIELVFGKKITSGTHLMFRKSNCGIVVRNYNLNAGTLEFEISDKSQAEVLASSFSKLLKGTSVLLATVQPVRWFSELEVKELPVGYEDAVEEFQEDLLHAIFPDLTDDQVDKLVEKLCLTDEEGFEAYRNHQASVSDFEKTTVEVYPSQDSEKPYKITVEYDADHSTLLLSYLAE